MDLIGNAILTITKINGHYLFLFQEDASNPLLTQVRHEVPINVRSEILKQFSQIVDGGLRLKVSRLNTNNSKIVTRKTATYSENELLNSLSAELTQLMIPREIITAIENCNVNYLTINTNDPSIPWEILSINGSFLAKNIPIGKLIPTTEKFSTSKPFTAKSILKVLILSDPTQDLEGAKLELNKLSKLFSSSINFSFDTLYGQDVSISAISKLVRHNTYDVVHYSGHSSFDVESAQSHVYFKEGKVSASYLLNIFGQDVPPLFFFNSCSSGTIGGQEYEAGQLNGLVGSFLSAGARVFIGALWPIVDIVATNIACEFYHHIGKCLSIGESLMLARTAVQDEDLTWLGYSLVGDPSVELISNKNWTDNQNVSDGHMATRAALTGQGVSVIGGIHPLIAAQTRGHLECLTISSECTISQRLVVKKGIEATLLSDLIGKTIAYPPLSGMEFFVKHSCQDEGLSLDQFSILHLQQDEIIRAMELHRLDAAVIWEPWLSYFEMKGEYKIIELKNQRTDYTVCPLAIEMATTENIELVEELLIRYFYCVKQIKNKSINVAQLLALQFGLEQNVIEKALSKFNFLDSTDLANSEITNRIREYFNSESAYLRQELNLDNLSMPLLDNLKYFKKSDYLEPNKNLPPIAVSAQNSISNAPFFVGRFLNLFC